MNQQKAIHLYVKGQTSQLNSTELVQMSEYSSNSIVEYADLFGLSRGDDELYSTLTSLELDILFFGRSCCRCCQRHMSSRPPNLVELCKLTVINSAPYDLTCKCFCRSDMRAIRRAHFKKNGICSELNNETSWKTHFVIESSA